MKKKLSIMLLSLSFLLISVCCACAQETITVETVTFTDDLHRRGSVPAFPAPAVAPLRHIIQVRQRIQNENHRQTHRHRKRQD